MFRPNQHQLDVYREIFESHDTNNDGHLDIRELKQILRRNNKEIPSYAVDKIMRLGDKDGNGKLSLDEFIDIVEHPELKDLFKFGVDRYIKYLLPPKDLQAKPFRRDDYEFGTPMITRGGTTYEEVDGSSYDDQYSCCPPPIGMFVMTITEIILFMVDAIRDPGSEKTGRGEIGQALYFNPYHREQAWRFLTYMFVHIGYMHLTINCIVQFMLALPLELVHGSWRVLTIYFSGVIGGSLFTAVVDPTVRLAGASGGVYSIITAHIASIVMNWSEMTLPFVQLFVFVVIVGVDFGTSIWNRYTQSEDSERIGYEAHLAGAIYGVFVGIIFLRNLIVKRYERYIWWSSVAFVSLTLVIMIIINLMYIFETI